MGLPGKPKGFDGGEVERYFHEGKIKEIADYCETDVVGRRQRRSAELLTFPDSNALLPAQGYCLAPRFMFASITHRSFPGERGVFLTSCGPSFSHRFSDPQFLTLGIRTSV